MLTSLTSAFLTHSIWKGKNYFRFLSVCLRLLCSMTIVIFIDDSHFNFVQTKTINVSKEHKRRIENYLGDAKCVNIFKCFLRASTTTYTLEQKEKDRVDAQIKKKQEFWSDRFWIEAKRRENGKISIFILTARQRNKERTTNEWKREKKMNVKLTTPTVTTLPTIGRKMRVDRQRRGKSQIA